MRFFISLATLFFLSLPVYAFNFEDNNGCPWEIIGDFSKRLRNMPPDAILLRTCSLKPVDKDKAEVKKVTVCEYKGERTVIELALPQNSRYIEDVTQDLLKFNLGRQDNHLKSIFVSDNPNNFMDFLNLFSSRDIIGSSLGNKILEIAATKPNEPSLQKTNQEFEKGMEVLLESYVKGKKVLDIGTGDGKKAKRMKEMGAESVLGIEPNEQICMLAKGELGDNHVLNKRVQELTNDYNEQFDLITIINFNIFFEERPSVAKKIKKLLKPGGKLIIGICDNKHIKDLENDRESVFGVFNTYLTSLKEVKVNSITHSLFVDILALIYYKPNSVL